MIGSITVKQLNELIDLRMIQLAAKTKRCVDILEQEEKDPIIRWYTELKRRII